MKRDSFVFYKSFSDAIDTLPDDEQLKVYKALKNYSLLGIEPDFEGAPLGMFLLMKPQIDANNRKYENGCKGGRPTETKDKPSNNQAESKAERNVNVNDNVNVPDNVNDNDNVVVGGNGKQKRKQQRFKPPEIHEIEDYCFDRKNTINANSFFDYYQSKGWMIGKNKMKDWKAAIRTWERKDRDGPRSQSIGRSLADDAAIQAERIRKKWENSNATQ